MLKNNYTYRVQNNALFSDTDLELASRLISTEQFNSSTKRMESGFISAGQVKKRKSQEEQGRLE